MNPGIIQVYTGDGKGKTTAAMGLAIRAWGRGLNVVIFQMLKAPATSGEQLALATLCPPLPIQPLGSGNLILEREPSNAEIGQAKEGWEKIIAAIDARTYDLIVIDELSHAINLKLLKEADVIKTLQSKPVELELILTGAGMPGSILEMADLVTEMKSLKHPFQNGLKARKGIEF